MQLEHRTLPQQTLSALIEASATINGSLDLQTTLEAIARTAAMVVQAEASSVLLLDPRRNKLVFKAAIGDRGGALLNEEFDANLGIAGKVAATGQPMLVTDVRQDKAFFKGIDDKSSFTTRGLVAAPLIHQNRTIGVVEVLNKIGA
ncbi:MAG: GAF domain-containing protein, partial [Phycisphaerae bacterium]|nr:GAF domain-containing protein [Phycisphaerae bacterium]